MKTLLAGHVPQAALAYCLVVGSLVPFTLRLAPARRSRLGDYRLDDRRGHLISVNADLHPEAFLITFLHEVAHCHVQARAGRSRVAVHGPDWQHTFSGLLQPVLTNAVFSPEVLTPLLDYARRPRATTAAHLPLLRALRGLPLLPDLPQGRLPQGRLPLETLPDAATFRIGKRIFIRQQRRRSRFLCLEPGTGRFYTVSALALVETCMMDN